jgi:hypothetical protein
MILYIAKFLINYNLKKFTREILKLTYTKLFILRQW